LFISDSSASSTDGSSSARAFGPARTALPGLDGLRFCAAALVFVYHVEGFKRTQDWISPLGDYLAPRLAGREGVRLFFVLSGFLITYLLLIEHRATSRINIPRFYLRRVLRIWPLYYLIVALSFFVLPHVIHFSNYNELLKPDFGKKLLLYLALLPNLTLYWYPAVLYASQAWSIGIEEQFYLLWPWFLRAIARRPFVPLLGVVLGKIMVDWIAATWFQDWRLLNGYLDDFEIEGMALGGLTSLVLLRPRGAPLWLQHPAVRVANYALLGAALHYKLAIPHSRLLIEAACAWLILQTASATRRNRLLDHGWIKYLGRISYGIYMFHSLGIVLALLAVGALANRSALANPLVYAGSALFSVALAVCSYEGMERRFIRLKRGVN